MICNPGKVVTQFQFSQLFSRAWFKGMTMSNVITGFQITGVYPLNPNALLPPKPRKSFDPSELSRQSGLNFMPLYSSPKPSPKSDVITFTDEEIALNERRYLEGYDLPNPCYNQWLSTYHPIPDSDHRTPSPVQSILFPQSTFSRFIDLNKPQLKLPIPKSKSSACVLTSAEHMTIMDEKELKKLEDAKLKEINRKKERGKAFS